MCMLALEDLASQLWQKPGMNLSTTLRPDAMAARAAEASALLRLLANEKRLLILCRLVAEGEVPAGALLGVTGLSQPALSQHLAAMRAEGLVATRRVGTQIRYRLADPRAAALLARLHDIFCAEAEG
jgi:DNA-binding transcriptional ArsR family regulator